MDEFEPPIFFEEPRGNGVAENSIVPKIGGDHDNGAIVSQAPVDLKKGLGRIVEVLDDHTTGDQVEAVVGKGQMIQRSLCESSNVAVRGYGKVHADDRVALGDEPVLEWIHVVLEKTIAATSVEPYGLGEQMLGDEAGVSLGFSGPSCAG